MSKERRPDGALMSDEMDERPTEPKRTFGARRKPVGDADAAASAADTEPSEAGAGQQLADQLAELAVEQVFDTQSAEQGAGPRRRKRPRSADDDESGDGEDGGLWPVDRLMPVLEAVVFAAADPLPVRRMRDAVEGATTAEVKAALVALQRECSGRGIRLVEVAGGWQFRTAPEHHEVVKRLFKERPFRLTRAAIETMAVVAYRQPVTRAEIEAIRGVDVSSVLELLIERRLVRVAGRRDVPGRPLVYTTTQDFLEMFGLKDLKSLPTLAELGDEFQNMADQSGFSDPGERNAAVLPVDAVEPEEESGGHEDQEARTAERADQVDEERTRTEAK
jgi:segregation and condensation protein B